MKQLTVLFLLAGLVGAGGCLKAHEQGGDKSIGFSGKVNIPVISQRGDKVFLQLLIRTPRTERPHRKPLNVAVVLDRSGSMGDERKIEFAKSALTSLIHQLSDRDILSVVIYDDVVEVLRPAGKMRDKRELLRHLENVYPRGSTNLGGGMLEGYRQVERFANKEYTNRVILLSDGLANEGITDPHRLNTIARKNKTHAISLTTMGVGLDYNENLMVGLAEHGGGNYYFIEHPRSIAHILNREFEALSSILAQNATIELKLGKGVRLIDVIGYEWNQEGEQCKISLGDIPSDVTNEMTVELQVPPGTGTLSLASGTLAYESDKISASEQPSFETTIAYTDRQEEIEENRNMEIQAKADVAVSTKQVEEAMELLDAGKGEEAERTLSAAKQTLLSSPAAAAAGAGSHINDQAEQIGSFQSLLKDSTDTRKAKKSIQYQNYKTQKNKE
ncbi:MAG TPA: VWA domain-containing protein [Bacteroidota bacterium]|nr:VWA domain-containing protein [Bacteroidota bacterium]